MKIDWKTLPSLVSLRAFELTARAGNFASAAREINVTHAAIAQRVRALENELGTHLVKRTGRSIELTDAGSRLADSLTQGFEKIASGIEEFRKDQQDAPLRISATLFVSQVMVLPRLHEFWEKHPGIQITITPSPEVVDIAAAGMDMAIRATSETPDWPGLIAEPLVTSEIVVVGTPTLVTDNMPSLHDLPWVLSQNLEYQKRVARAIGLDTEKLKSVDLGSPILHLSSVRQGLGLTFTSEILVRDDLASGTLRRAPVPSPFSVTYYAVTPTGPARPQIKTFINWLKAVLAKQGTRIG